MSDIAKQRRVKVLHCIKRKYNEKGFVKPKSPTVQGLSEDTLSPIDYKSLLIADNTQDAVYLCLDPWSTSPSERRFIAKCVKVCGYSVVSKTVKRG